MVYYSLSTGLIPLLLPTVNKKPDHITRPCKAIKPRQEGFFTLSQTCFKARGRGGGGGGEGLEKIEVVRCKDNSCMRKHVGSINKDLQTSNISAGPSKKCSYL